MKADEALVAHCATKTKLRINPEEFRDPKNVLRRGFPFRNERLDKEADEIKWLLAHLAMARFAMENMLVPWLIEDAKGSLSVLGNLKAPLAPADLDRLKPAMDQLDRVGRLCANLLDVLQGYEVYLGEACALMDRSYAYKRPNRSVAHVYEFELTGAAHDVLLSRNAGRHAPAPLIRSAIEVGITRLVLDPKHTTKYQDCSIEGTRRLNADMVLDVCIAKNIPVALGAENLKRLYDWGSVFVHLGYRYPHEELWYAFRIAESSRKGFVSAKDDSEAQTYYDVIVGELHRKGAIRIRDRDGHVISPPKGESAFGRVWGRIKRLGRRLADRET